jgi:hypothetical protein
MLVEKKSPMEYGPGRAGPSLAMQPAVAKKGNRVLTTSSPGPMPSAINAAGSASVPEVRAQRSVLRVEIRAAGLSRQT